MDMSVFDQGAMLYSAKELTSNKFKCVKMNRRSIIAKGIDLKHYGGTVIGDKRQWKSIVMIS